MWTCWTMINLAFYYSTKDVELTQRSPLRYHWKVTRNINLAKLHLSEAGEVIMS